MKTTTLVSVCVLAGAVIAVGAYQLGARRNALASEGSTMASASIQDAKLDPKSGRRVLYWHDPMVPGPKFDKPGKSPFMDMQLVPVYADEAAGSGVTVNPGVAQNLGIRTAVVRKGDMSANFEAVGMVTQNERATEVVQSRVTGYIEKLQVRAVLDPVRKGQPLATLYAPDWAAALEEYLGVRRAQAGPALVDAARARLRLLSIPEDVVTRSEQSGAAQTRFTLTAPTSGVVAELGVRDGAMVSPGTTLFRISDLSSVWVMADVPESLASQARVGSDVEVRVVGLGDTFAGKVSAILPDVDPATRTVKARVELRNPGLVLKPGMFARVTFKSSAVQPALLIPQEAVIATGKRNVVIAADEGGKYRPVEVQLGRESGSDVEVKSGLLEGQRVVSSGQFLLDSEASLKSGLNRLEASASAAAPAHHSGEGKIEAIDKDELTISHGPIASLKWGPMTMPFKNPKEGLPKDLKVGARVSFDFVQRGDDYVLQSVTPVPAGTKP
ncbi:efflux RND transporter periplasmic adaptor subunit [Polaromonas jejuensis]|uniref:Efflux RND transporter periplasmic adaptor subunit n=1 Tax=Polaromonas jejuensis TaxID=457502 RepID=A0ABW0QBV0_9BURK|nr:efflux RND transporter periplasmic adaptor subunit [Polaromonas jejuensis]